MPRDRRDAWPEDFGPSRRRCAKCHSVVGEEGICSRCHCVATYWGKRPHVQPWEPAAQVDGKPLTPEDFE